MTTAPQPPQTPLKAAAAWVRAKPNRTTYAAILGPLAGWLGVTEDGLYKVGEALIRVGEWLQFWKMTAG